MNRGEIVDRYATESGRDVSQLDFYEALASYKLAIILEGIHARFLMGKTLGEGFDHIGNMVEAIVVGALDQASTLVDSRAARLIGRVADWHDDGGSDGMGVLDGVNVLEVAEQGFVPSAAAILAEWGADVVKVERPTGDPLRQLREAGRRAARRGLQHPLRAVQPQQARHRDRSPARRRPAHPRRVDRVGRRVHHELPAVDPHEVATDARRRVGGQSALRVRDRQRARPRRPRRRPGRVRRRVVLGARWPRSHPHAAGRSTGDVPGRDRRRAERRVPRGRNRGRAREASAHRRRIASSTCRCWARRCGRCRSTSWPPRRPASKPHRMRPAPR